MDSFVVYGRKPLSSSAKGKEKAKDESVGKGKQMEVEMEGGIEKSGVGEKGKWKEEEGQG